MFDVKKITQTPQNQWEAVTLLVKSEQNLIDALWIMQSVIDHPDLMDYHTDRINKFLNKFKTEQP